MEEKQWYLSKTVWATVLIVVIAIFKMLGKSEVAQTIEGESAGIADWIVQLATIILAGIAFISRLTAKTKLTP